LRTSGRPRTSARPGTSRARRSSPPRWAIHTIEARHAATLQLLTNESPTPDGAFAKPMTMAQVLAVVKPFIA